MPFALLFIGAIFLVAAIRGTHKELFDILKDDFASANNFFVWGLAFFVIGAIGYYAPLRPVSRSFMALIVLVLLLSNRGFFNSFRDQISG